ncbi:platelet binding protein GspB-like [Hylaeus volcanicus]|uniref:platelet binding protein GspB-like n=1 Tax=Hylaeus volcanicus TaxID=313075 RepID=UPI0023B80EE4|nr:platelet binding protein GspB-like [Hylaeus volcanicus]
MKLLLQLAASILLTSVCASGWPYREIVGVGQSAAPLLVAPVYGLAPATRLLPPEAEKELATVVAGPVTGTTFVEGSSSGPVTIQLPGNAVNQVENVLPPIEKASDVASVSDDSVLIKGASAGPVTLVAASDNSVASADNAASARAATKNEAVASSASGKATVAIENTEESARNTARISETVGVASAKAVIGPSTGPIVIVGPTAPPLPTIIPPTVTPLEAATSDASISARAASTASSSASTTSTTNVASTISNSASSSASAASTTNVASTVSNSASATSSASSSANTAAPVSSSSNAASTASSSASASTASNSDSAAATAAANIAASEAESPRELNNGPSLARDATEETGAEVSTSSSTVATRNSGNSVVTASARVNFITPAATIAVDEASLSNVVVSTPTIPSAVVSVPSGSISATAASALFLQAPL